MKKKPTKTLLVVTEALSLNKRLNTRIIARSGYVDTRRNFDHKKKRDIRFIFVK